MIANSPADPDRLRAAAAMLAHRGPDDEGIETVGTVPPFAGLAHRRLSIIDLSAAGRQPMTSPAGARIVFNGEIYNYRELRTLLEKEGRVFRTASDTEAILAAYEKWGDACVEHLDGMFAFAIWDERRKRLFAARDRFGKKPFWYHAGADGSLRFASELRALLALGGVPAEVDPGAIPLLLVYQYVPAPRSILRGVLKLPPAHGLAWEAGRLRVERYWSPLPEVGVPADAEGAARLVRSRLQEAVRKRLVADVPVGAFLSGGIDSSIAVALMARLSSHPVHTFSIGFDEEAFDETPFARKVAAACGTVHHEFRVRADAADMLPRIVEHYGEPFADSSAIPTFYLARETSRCVKSALTGDGGDEMFLGYDRYRAVRLAQGLDAVPLALRRAAAPLALANRLSASGARTWRNLGRFLAAVPRDPRRRYLGWVSIFDADELGPLLSPELAAAAGDPGAFLDVAYAAAPPLPDFVARTAWADLATYLPNDLLVKVDIAAMAWGLETRSPFLDPSVAALALALPTRLKMQGGRGGGKWILRKAFADLLPAEVLKRRKMGFGVPIGHWMRGPLRERLEETLSTRRIEARGWLRPGAVRRLVDAHLAGRAWHPYRLWSLLILETWAERFLKPL